MSDGRDGDASRQPLGDRHESGAMGLPRGQPAHHAADPFRCAAGGSTQEPRRQAGRAARIALDGRLATGHEAHLLDRLPQQHVAAAGDDLAAPRAPQAADGHGWYEASSRAPLAVGATTAHAVAASPGRVEIDHVGLNGGRPPVRARPWTIRSPSRRARAAASIAAPGRRAHSVTSRDAQAGEGGQRAARRGAGPEHGGAARRSRRVRPRAAPRRSRRRRCSIPRQPAPSGRTVLTDATDASLVRRRRPAAG